ncbi:MAG: hypothetical protein A2X86_07710 [Bdellovibrionales bacterium GWA2_49_15]|nr:MAG: hypothetical protein A2X86_07710 [Bdellovibrionales bacterium GWA2_49_15]HAZ11836.1 hypothetical protein [Bdellovibrionales bacterium]
MIIRHLTASFLVISLLLVGCSKSAKQKKEDAIVSANILLTKKKCDAAITLLESVGRDVSDVNYLKALASAYACKGGFSVLKLFADDLPLISSPAPMGGATRFSTSVDMDSPTYAQYLSLQTAIDILLYAGGISTTLDPTVARRAALFSAADAKEINAFLMYLLLAQLGRYFYFYSNANAAGVKGGGTGPNDCFMNYENLAFSGGFADMTAWLGSAATGACVSPATVGHPDLGADNAIDVPLACEGIVLLNNFMAIFPGVIAGMAGDDFDDLETLETAMNAGKVLAEANTPGSDTKVNNVLSQERCESLNDTSDDYIQTYFAFMMETLVQ